jgi:hypothetical protein
VVFVVVVADDVDVELDVAVDFECEPHPTRPTPTEMAATATPMAAADFFIRSSPAVGCRRVRQILAGLNHADVSNYAPLRRIFQRTNMA